MARMIADRTSGYGGAGGAILVVSVLSCAIFILARTNWYELSEAASGVLDGRPHWRAYQNRLLGPWLVLGLSKVGISHRTALIVFSALAFLVHNFLLAHFLRRLGQSPLATTLWVLFFCTAFLLLQHRWFYTWDSIDLILFTCVFYAVYFGAPDRVFLILFSIGLMNRESALFIALFLVLDGASLLWQKSGEAKGKAAARLILGVVLLILGGAATKLARDFLFVERQWGGADLDHALLGNHLRFADNVRDIFYVNWFNRNVLHTAPLVLFLSFLILTCPWQTRRQRVGTLIALALFGGVLIFGAFNETRMLLPFLTLFTFCVVDLRSGAAATTGQPTQSRL